MAHRTIWLGVWLVLGCAAAVQPAPCPAASPPTSPVTKADSTECTTDAQCQAHGGECVVSARCVSGRCQAQLKPSRTRCALSDVQQSYQNVYISERDEAGICRQGACIPRMQCAELCAVERGPELWKKYKIALDACQAQKPDSGSLCADQLGVDPQMQLEAKRVTDACLVDCGFPDLDAR